MLIEAWSDLRPGDDCPPLRFASIQRTAQDLSQQTAEHVLPAGQQVVAGCQAVLSLLELIQILAQVSCELMSSSVHRDLIGCRFFHRRRTPGKRGSLLVRLLSCLRFQLGTLRIRSSVSVRKALQPYITMLVVLAELIDPHRLTDSKISHQSVADRECRKGGELHQQCQSGLPFRVASIANCGLRQYVPIECSKCSSTPKKQ